MAGKRKLRITLLQTPCRRGCGKMLVTLNRSLMGNDEARSRLAGICENCITDEERAEILDLKPTALLPTGR